jgi:hypothetical protein
MIIHDKASRDFLLRLSGVMREPGKQIFIDAGNGKDMNYSDAFLLGDIITGLIVGAVEKGNVPEGYMLALNKIADTIENETPWNRDASMYKAEAKFAGHNQPPAAA